MAGFRFNVFKGLRPRVSKRKLPPGEAQTAQNLRLGSGDLEPWAENSTVIATDDAYQTRTIYLYDDYQNNQAFWFQWTNFVDVARGPVKGDVYDRVYFTGDGRPKVTWNTLQQGPPFPTQSYDLGIPKPITRLTAEGQPLPEDLEATSRRTSTETGQRLQTGSFEIVSVDFTTYPGTGTPNDTWRLSAEALGDITFQVDVGDTFKVLEVIDANTIKLGSATGTGAVGATAANDKTSVNYWHPMDEQGSTQEADFVGWRIPDGMQATITDHRLRLGDVIRVTRLDLSYGLAFSWALTSDLFELSAAGETGEWGVPILGDDSVYHHENVRLGRSADGQTLFELTGGFYYDVDRTSSENDVLEDRTYVYTYVSSIGEEGPPSDPSSLVSAFDGDTVTLTGFDLSPEGIRDINRVRIYRTNATAVGTEYQFVMEVPFSTLLSEGQAVDTVEAALLGEIIQTTTWFPPPSDMQGIVSMPNGMMVGFRGKDIFFSEPYFPHSWPPEYDQAVDYEIVALAPFGNSVAVLTKGTPYVLTGSHPRNVNIRPYKINQACSYKESVALANDKVYYASPDGLVEIGVNGARVVTEPYVWKKEWADFEPELMVGEFHDDKYFGFYGADNTVVPQPTGSLAATGTLVTDVEVFESDIISGGKTIILTLTDDTWVAAGSTFDNVRTNIIFSITADQSEGNGWNNQRINIPVTDVVRTSDTVVTITLSALPGYSVTGTEILTIKAPAIALTGQSTLTAPEQATILADSIYSTEVVVTTGYSVSGPEGNVPEVLVSDENPDNWVRISAPGGLLPAQATNLRDAAYHKALDRWAAIGEDSLAADRTRILTADVVDDTASWVTRYTTTFPRGRVVIYDDTTQNFFAGGDGFILYSPAGINWSFAPLPTAVQGRQISGLARAPQGGGGLSPYIYGIFDDVKNVVRSANLASSPLSTAWTSIGTPSTSGTGHVGIASGDGIVMIMSGGGDIGYYIQGDTTYTAIGALALGSRAGLVFGGGRWIAYANDGTYQYVDSPDETTIGNWSTVQTAIDGAGTQDLCKIVYDEGGDGRIGFGFIATLSASGAPGAYNVYTSEDGLTWTLKKTVSNTQDALGIGVKYPASDLSGTTGATVTLTGASIFYWDDVDPPTTKLIVRRDGRVAKARFTAQTILSPDTDWIIPNFANDDLYEVRVTNVVVEAGGGVAFSFASAAEDTWIALSADRSWEVDAPSLGGVKRVSFDLEIRYNGGAVLASARYTLTASFFDYRGDLR